MSNSSEDEEVKESSKEDKEPSKEDSQKPGKVEISLKQVSQLDWSTSQVRLYLKTPLIAFFQTLELIEADFTPALVMMMNSEDTNDNDCKSLAIQCRFLPNQTGNLLFKHL